MRQAQHRHWCPYVPRMRPPVLCAPAKGAAKQNATARIVADKVLRQHMERSCREPWHNLHDLTPLPRRIFETDLRGSCAAETLL